MSTRNRRGDSAAMAGVRRRFERWRRNRKVGTRIPETLWGAAVKAAKRWGVAQTSRALSLDYYTLKNRLEDKPGKRVKAASSVAASTGHVETAFLELPPAAPGLGECIVELDSGDGAKMRVQLKGVEAPDLVALSRSFWDVES